MPTQSTKIIWCISKAKPPDGGVRKPSSPPIMPGSGCLLILRIELAVKEPGSLLVRC
ncbi:hypothetical protein EVA_03076 [gut metagenome]|uniref:Uncharacterized protein n=1 Tax=gut metagenome TaxID=749906 RepID=J9GMN0_9ZZZZ